MIYSKIVGSTFTDKGQELIKTKIKVGDILNLVRDYKNQHDLNTIQVQDRNINVLGYIQRELAQEIAHRIDTGSFYFAQVVSITGKEGLNVGCNIKIRGYDKSKTEELYQKYNDLKARNSEDLPNSIEEYIIMLEEKDDN